MNSGPSVNSAFGIPIYELQIESFNSRKDALVAYFLEMREVEKGKTVSNQGGWHSKNNLHQSDEDSVKWMIGEIQRHSLNCIKHSKTLPKNARLGLAACWANINETGDWNAPHAHFPADWSGVCYVQVNPKSAESVKSDKDGDILFFNPLPIGPQYHRPPTISKRPKNGQILLFPSYLVHMVAPHFESDPRVSVAFNFRISAPGPN